MRITTTSSGGSVIRKTLKEAARQTRQPKISVGFFSTAKYPDGTPVAAVAAWNEFGTRSSKGNIATPERPFFRNALTTAPDKVTTIIAKRVNPKTLRVTRPTANLIGAVVKGEIDTSIIELDSPENAAITVARKGSTNPLVGVHGILSEAATYRVE